MASIVERLPAWVTWRRRPFPDANLLLLHGRHPALVDSSFVGHAHDTADRVRAHVGLLQNTQNRADEAVQHKLKAVTDGLANLMEALAEEHPRLRMDSSELRHAVGLEDRESSA